MSGAKDEKISKAMIENEWVAWVNKRDIWTVGRTKNGILEVLGVGKSLEDAFKKAERVANYASN